MLTVKEYIKKKSFPTEYDYIFTKYSDYLALKPYLLPKIEGTLKITFNQIPIEDAVEITDNENSEFTQFEVYLKKDVLGRYYTIYPTKLKTNLSNWELFHEMLGVFKKNIEHKAVQELYRRAGGDLNKISEILEVLSKQEESTITLSHIDKFIQKVDIVYPRDVFLCALTKMQPSLKDSITFLKIYARKSPIALLTQCEEKMNRSHIYYSLRKRVIKLFEDKVLYLHNEQPTDKTNAKLVKYIDSLIITRLYSMFLNSSPSLVYQIIADMTKGEIDKDYFDEMYLNPR